MKEKKDDFVAKVKKHRELKAEQITLLLQGLMLQEGIPVYDVHYIANRTIKVLEEVTKAIDFKDKEIREQRKELLEKCVKSAFSKLNFVEFEEDPDQETQVRNDRCEPIAREFVNQLLDRDLIMSDTAFLDEAIREDDEFLFYKNARGYLDVVHNQMITALAIQEKMAEEKLWGVPREKITYQMLDDLLKK